MASNPHNGRIQLFASGDCFLELVTLALRVLLVLYFTFLLYTDQPVTQSLFYPRCGFYLIKHSGRKK